MASPATISAPMSAPMSAPSIVPRCPDRVSRRPHRPCIRVGFSVKGEPDTPSREELGWRCPPGLPPKAWSTRFHVLADMIASTDAYASSSSSSKVVADLGCGHGMLALGLAASGRVSRAIAIDVSPDEIEVANAKAARANEAVAELLGATSPLPVDVRLGDGARALVPEDAADVVCVAGVGGRTMIKMLKAAGLDKPKPTGVRTHDDDEGDDDEGDACAGVIALVLNPPATDVPSVRAWLIETNAWIISDERLVVENEQMHAMVAATRRDVSDREAPVPAASDAPVRVVEREPAHDADDDARWGGDGSCAGGGGEFAVVADVHVGPVLRVVKPKILGLYLRNRVEYFENRRRGALDELRRCQEAEARSPAVECSLALSSEDEDAASFLVEARARRRRAQAEVTRLSKIVGVMSTVLGEVNMKALEEAGLGGTLDLPQAR